MNRCLILPPDRRFVLLAKVELAVLVAFSLLACSPPASSQDVFELAAPDEAARSRAERTASQLTVTDAAGQTFQYTRAPEHDSPDGTYAAYANVALRRVIRWPVSDTGAMLIGERVGNDVRYRESLMRIQPVVAGRPRGRSLARRARWSPPPHVAARQDALGTVWAAFVDDDGQLQLAAAEGGSYRLHPAAPGSTFPPGARLALAGGGPQQRPRVYLVGQDGRIAMVGHDGTVATVSPLTFPVGADLAVLDRGGVSYLCAIDEQGRLSQMRLDTHLLGDWIEPAPNELAPGGALAATETGSLWTIDRHGLLRRYQLAGAGWQRADPADGLGMPLGADFKPGGRLAAAVAAPPGAVAALTEHVVTADVTGRIALLYQTLTPQIWRRETFDLATAVGDTPIVLARGPSGLLLSTIGPLGEWHVWEAAAVDGPWRDYTVARGMRPFAPVCFPLAAPTGFGIDAHGRLVVAAYRGPGDWLCHVCAPGLGLAPRLVSREVVPHPPLPPAKINLKNSHSRELWVLVAWLSDPRRVMRVKVPAGESRTIEIERDAGATLVERFAAPGPFGGVDVEERSFAIPPQTLYDVSVYELFLQSVAIDRTKKGGGRIEDANWSPRSIGVFPLPPGDLLHDGQSLDVFQEAKLEKNPGGVRKLDPQEWKSE